MFDLPLPLIGGVALAVLLVLGLLIAMTLRRVVPTNMVHIVQSKNSTTSYGKGRQSGNVYYEWPSSLPFIGVTVTHFPESVFDVALKDYEAYDVGRLPFRVDIMAFFRISDSDTAAHRVANFGELQTQLQSILQGAVRSVLANEKLEEIMQDRTTLGAKFTAEVDSQLAEWGVQTVKSIEFMDIRDSGASEVIQQIMAKEKSRIERESRETVADNHRAAEEREIEARRQVDLQKQEAEQQVGERTALTEKAVGIAKEQSKQEVLSQSRTTAEREMEVKRVEEVKAAEIARDVAEVRAAQDKNVAIVNAEASRETEVIAAGAEKQKTELIAQGHLTQAQLNAQGIEAEGTAKAAAEKAMQLAPVQAQITLAQEIGNNEGYQNYLVSVRQIEAGQAVGSELAKAIGTADLKVIANSGDVQSGVASIGDLFTANGGTKLTSMLTALAQTEAGQALVKRITGDEGPVTGTAGTDTAPPPRTRTRGGGAERNGSVS